MESKWDLVPACFVPFCPARPEADSLLVAIKKEVES